MNPRRSLREPITLAVVMIVLLVILTVGWVLLAVFAAWDAPSAGWYWVALIVGASFCVLLLVGVVQYLVLSIKTINLTRRQSNFIDSVTHELKSPIASMKLYLQTLNRRQVSPEEQANFYRFMLDDCERLDHLINQMLDAGRLDSGRVDAEEAVDVPLDELLRQCAQTVCLGYRVPPETVAFDLTPCVVRARRADLEMIFRNLIDNAVKYAAADPQVEVSLAPAPKDQVVVRVGDNGRGIPPKMRRKIFGRFVRLGMELEREKPGTGLGLYIVRTQVGRLKGSIRVRNRDEGTGAVFEVRLPGKRA